MHTYWRVKKIWIKFSYKISCSLRLQFSFKKINFTTYFENLTVGLHVLYILNMHVKFHSSWILFTIKFINLFFIHNLIL